MEVKFKRRLVNELLTTYLPSFLLLGICYATTHFKSFYFEAAVTVNLTVMLVSTTLFIRCIPDLFSKIHTVLCIFQCDGEAAPYILRPAGRYLVDQWSAGSVPGGHLTHRPGTEERGNLRYQSPRL